MKRTTCFVMALALVLGLAQCKKEQPLEPTSEDNSVHITLNVNGGSNNGTRVNVNPDDNPMITFENGDEIHVASNGLHVGTLIYNNGTFSGPITNATYGEPLYFYFFGNVTPQFFGENRRECTVYIGDQTKELPVISMGESTEPFSQNNTTFSATLHNKCSLMKFNVTNETNSSIYINGMNNFVNVHFDRSGNDGFIDGFKYSQVYNGEIKMKGQEGSGTKTYWAIVLPQAFVAEGGAYTEDHTNIGMRPEIADGIGLNQYYSNGIDISMISYDPIGTPLTFEAKTAAGATVTLSRKDAPGISSLEISTDGDTWTDYWVGDIIPLDHEGATVMFRGTNTRYATSTSNYHKFSINGDCYVYGNIMSLIDSTDYADPDYPTQLNPTFSYHFANLFQGCTGLYTHPQKTLELPATGLADYCYSYMFSGCTHLTKAPELPTGHESGEFLRTGCYQGMFEGCTSLTASPVLWATGLVSNCYDSMFNNCTSLSRVTCLATTTGDSYTSNWLSDVAARGTFIKSSNATSWTTGPNGIPSDWSVENY